MTARIVVVEDDPSVAELVMLYLRNADFIVAHARTAAEARVKFSEEKPALVILDLGLPDANGLELLREIRKHADTPVLALTARAEDLQKIEALESGMDDYMTKPFNPKELVARVRAILRRTAGMPGSGRTIVIGNVRIDPARHEVHVRERPVSLRAKEFELLEAFCRQPGIVLTRDRLLEDVWGFAYPGETRTVDVHVKQLRDKLADADTKIETVWGVGYKLVRTRDQTESDREDERRL
ncbi:MAG TPA: response regulator transcription factor [Candidatus Limnocylindria bacterium]